MRPRAWRSGAAAVGPQPSAARGALGRLRAAAGARGPTRWHTLALSDAERPEGLRFRLAVETGEGVEVKRVVFLALRSEDGETECFWPVPLDHADVSAPAGRNAGAALTPPPGGWHDAAQGMVPVSLF